MKKLLIFNFCLFPFFAFAQTSLTKRQIVDSVVKAYQNCHTYTDIGKTEGENHTGKGRTIAQIQGGYTLRIDNGKVRFRSSDASSNVRGYSNYIDYLKTEEKVKNKWEAGSLGLHMPAVWFLLPEYAAKNIFLSPKLDSLELLEVMYRGEPCYLFIHKKQSSFGNKKITLEDAKKNMDKEVLSITEDAEKQAETMGKKENMENGMKDFLAYVNNPNHKWQTVYKFWFRKKDFLMVCYEVTDFLPEEMTYHRIYTMNPVLNEPIPESAFE